MHQLLSAIYLSPDSWAQDIWAPTFERTTIEPGNFWAQNIWTLTWAHNIWTRQLLSSNRNARKLSADIWLPKVDRGNYWAPTIDRRLLSARYLSADFERRQFSAYCWVPTVERRISNARQLSVTTFERWQLNADFWAHDIWARQHLSADIWVPTFDRKTFERRLSSARQVSAEISTPTYKRSTYEHRKLSADFERSNFWFKSYF